jgi:predicted ferric reductase
MGTSLCYNYSQQPFRVLKLNAMGNLLYVIAVILIIAWLIGFIGYSAGGIIHVLLVIAVIAIILRLIQGRRIL